MLLVFRRRALIIVTNTIQCISAEITAKIVQHHSQIGISLSDMELCGV